MCHNQVYRSKKDESGNCVNAWASLSEFLRNVASAGYDRFEYGVKMDEPGHSILL